MAVKELYDLTWSPRSLRSYDSILNYIGEKFGTVAVQKFVRRTMRVLEHVSASPTMFRVSDKVRNKHIVLITKQTTLYYRFKPRKKEVELLLFWDTRKNPKKLQYYTK